MARPGCYHVLVKRSPAHNMSTRTFVTIGDTPGSLGGIISQRFMAQS
ncbi:PAAR-like domain-containing protein [Azotobacter armeniacus]